MKGWGRSGRRMSYFPHCAVNFPIELSLWWFYLKVYHTIAETWTAIKSSKCSSDFQSKTHYHLYIKHHKISHSESSQKGEVAPNSNVTSMYWSASFSLCFFYPKTGVFFFAFLYLKSRHSLPAITFKLLYFSGSRSCYVLEDRIVSPARSIKGYWIGTQKCVAQSASEVHLCNREESVEG